MPREDDEGGVEVRVDDSREKSRLLGDSDDEDYDNFDDIPRMTAKDSIPADALDSMNVLAWKSYSVGDDAHVPKRERFSYDFPASLERSWRTFDDAVIGLCQSSFFRSLPIYYLSLFVTGMFSIEALVAAPVLLITTGYDGLGTEFTILALLCAFISQIPKRFIYRERPYLVRRALQCRSDTTSSIPSRTSLVAIVVAFGIAYAAAYGDAADNSDTLFSPRSWSYFALTPALWLLGSFARINLGVHYPSDCIAGAFLGALVSTLGGLIYHADVLGCKSCSKSQCYTAIDSPRVIDGANLDRVNIPLAIGFAFIAAACVVGSSLPPLRFWSKSHFVFGTLFACLAFQLTFLCPEYSPGRGSLPEPPSMSAGSVVFGATIIAVNLAFGIPGISGGVTQRILRFFAIFTLVYGLIVLWRVGINPPEAPSA